MKKIICITGIDGSGKSSTIDYLSTRLPECYVSHIWELLEQPGHGLPFGSKRDIDNFLCNLSPNSRLLFLAHALRYSIDKALASDKPVVLVNSYYYKYLATEMALGADPSLAQAIAGSFPQPDKVFELVLPLDEAARRKQKFSRYESGLAEKPDTQAFLQFQDKAFMYWDAFDTANWTQISSLKSTVEIGDQILSALR